MSTQPIGAMRRARLRLVVVTVAVTFVIAVLVAQSSAVWPPRVSSQRQPVTYLSTRPYVGKLHHHFAPGCHPKVGCVEEPIVQAP